jgi:uncharacterized protein (TIGR01244 family)
MNLTQISETFSVSGQILPDEIAAIQAAGFRAIICNRPDNETPGQPAFETIRAVADKAGLEMRHIPVVPGQLTAGHTAAFKAALSEMPEPVLAYCGSGKRAEMLWNMAKSAG